jgi:uncharacterized protein
MDEEKKRRVASKGGRAAHEKGTAHEFSSEEAREAGRKGGKTISQDREHMARIGRKGAKVTNQDRTRMRESGRTGCGKQSSHPAPTVTDETIAPPSSETSE